MAQKLFGYGCFWGADVEITKTCSFCGELFTYPKSSGRGAGRKLCSDKCRKRRQYTQRTKYKRLCGHCSIEYETEHPKQKYCSRSCNGKAIAESVCEIGECEECKKSMPVKVIFGIKTRFCTDCSANRKVAKDSDEHQRRRARKKIGGRVKKISSVKIFTRDNWTCQICGGTVSKEGGRFDGDYPEMDHIIPLSRGGYHVESNVQCLHRDCNMLKRDKLPSEMVRESLVEENQIRPMLMVELTWRVRRRLRRGRQAKKADGDEGFRRDL